MKMETLHGRRNKKIAIGMIVIFLIGITIGFVTSRASYRTTQSINIAHGIINYKMPDLNILALKVQKDTTSTDESNYDSADSIPTGSYELNTTKSYCTYSNNGEATNINTNMSYDSETGIVNLDITKKGTKCYLYFDIKASLLPSGYTQLEYISNTSQQYIDTGIEGQGNLEVEYKFKTGTLNNDWQGIVACDDAVMAVYIPRAQNRSSAGGNYFQFASFGSQTTSLISVSSNTEYEFYTNISPSSFIVKVNGTSYATSSYSRTPYKLGYNLTIFAENSKGNLNNRFMTGSIYYLIIKINGILERNFIPAKRNNDNVIGMYDTVSNTFFTNAGTGSFTPGPEV